MTLHISDVEWWLANAKYNAQLVLLDSGDPFRVAQQDAGFALIFETLRKDSTVVVEQDNQNRTVAVKISEPTTVDQKSQPRVEPHTKPVVETKVAPKPVAPRPKKRTNRPMGRTLDDDDYHLLLGLLQKHDQKGFNRACDEMGVDPKIAMETVNFRAVRECQARFQKP